MGERVNIQYSVDIDDLGKEIARLVDEAYSGLHTVALEKIPDKDNILSLRSIQMIDEVRQQLANIDLRMGDAVSLINGYVSYKSQVIEQQQIGHSADQIEPPQNEISDNLSDIRERLPGLANEDTD